MHTQPPRNALHPLSLLGVTAILMVLTGCGQLQDVRHRWCDPEPLVTAPVQPEVAPVVMPEAPPPQRYKLRLQADMLFQFDGSDLQQMKPSARQELDTLIAQLRNDFSQITDIVVVGHTDRLGNAAYNQRLSEKRAQTVKRYLQTHGITTPIEARGMGEAEPVTKDCVGSKATPALVQCLQPDRRVELDISGMKKIDPAAPAAPPAAP